MHQKMNVLIFLQYMPKKGSFEKGKKLTLTILVSSLIFIFSSQKKPLKIKKQFSAMDPYLPPQEHLFCLSHRKTRWTMSVENVSHRTCILETWNSIVTVTFVPWCKPKRSLDEFNNQSQIL